MVPAIDEAAPEQDPGPRNGATRLPELVLPAGGFAAGIAAFEGGADAIYLGFASFSARKQARNFSREDYRRILALAHSTGKRLYVTLNTVVLEEEFPEVASLLAFLGRFSPDALIIQDWGLAAMVRRSLPGIALHASTQTAIQTPAAARLAAEAGVVRVVLPRECSPLDLARFRDEAPGLEYEVFVHGALCYAFSGLCLASGMLLGRSGNRGECAQVCRSWYDASGLGGKGYWFSCRDLYLEDRLGEYVAAGAASLKVEGRMKSPEYVHAVARLYRGALDRLIGTGPDETEMESRRSAARLAFSRSPTPGWAGHHGGSGLLDPRFPGHRGLPLGRVLASRSGPGGTELTLDLDGELGLRDGIQAFIGREGEGMPEALAFSASSLHDGTAGRALLRAPPGARVFVPAPRSLPPGTAVFRISSRELDRREPSPEEYAPAVSLVPARIGITDDARLSLGLSFPRFDGTEGPGLELELEDGEALPFGPARSSGGFLRALGLFSESGGRGFRLEPTLADGASWQGEGWQTPLPLADLFVPPSLLKKAKNRMMERIERGLEEAEAEAARQALAGSAPSAVPPPPGFPPLPERRLLCFEYPGLPAGMPFALPRHVEESSALPESDGASWLPLAPLVTRFDSYSELVSARVAAELAAGKRFLVGIGGLHHAALARKLAAEHGKGAEASRLAFFCDVHCYLANSRALAAWSRFVPRLVSGYAWIEEGNGERKRLDPSPCDGWPPSPNSALPMLYAAGTGWNPPLFLSRGCMLRHGPGRGHCPAGCSRRWSTRLSDRGRRYVLIVDDCVTWLMGDNP